jgi:hypothetical protein
MGRSNFPFLVSRFFTKSPRTVSLPLAGYGYDYDEDDDDDEDYSNPPRGAMIDKVMDFDDSYYEETVLDVVQAEGEIPVRQDGGKIKNTSDFKNPEPVEWVTPLTTYNRKQDAFTTYGDEATLSWAYGDVCMIVRIGKAGDRLAFPTVDQVKTEYLLNWIRRHRDFY